MISSDASSKWYQMPSKNQVERLFNYTLQNIDDQRNLFFAYLQDLSLGDREYLLENLTEHLRELESALEYPDLCQESVSNRCKLLETYILIECLISEEGKEDYSRLENVCEELALHTSIDSCFSDSFIENLKSIKNSSSRIALEIFGDDGAEEAGDNFFKLEMPKTLVDKQIIEIPIASFEQEDQIKRRRVSLSSTFPVGRQKLLNLESVNRLGGKSNSIPYKEDRLRLSPRKKQDNDRRICLCTPRKLYNYDMKK